MSTILAIAELTPAQWIFLGIYVLAGPVMVYISFRLLRYFWWLFNGPGEFVGRLTACGISVLGIVFGTLFTLHSLVMTWFTLDESSLFHLHM